MIDDVQPTFPPLLTGHQVGKQELPLQVASQFVANNEFAAGDLFWSESKKYFRMALILEPEVELIRCSEILYVVMIAFGDAAGSLIPPEIGITYRWPNQILLNDGEVGRSDLIVAEQESDSCPNWLIVSLDIKIAPDDPTADSGENPNQTTMWDEGCVEITNTKLLESVSRHILNGIHNWTEEGFRQFHEVYTARLCKKRRLAVGLNSEEKFLDLDEHGNAVFSQSEGKLLTTIDALSKLGFGKT